MKKKIDLKYFDRNQFELNSKMRRKYHTAADNHAYASKNTSSALSIINQNQYFMKRSLSLLVFALLSMQLFSQPWMSQDFYSATPGQDANFYTIKDAFSKWAEDKDLSTVKGFKNYKRWEWFMEPRVYPSGKLPSQAVYWHEKQKMQSQFANKSIRNIAWTSMSPAAIPPAPDTTSLHGVGRINVISFHPTDSNTFFIGASQGGVWKTSDNGNSWVCLTDDLPVLRISDIAIDPNNPDVIYIATGDINYIGMNTVAAGRPYQFGIGVLKSTNGGVSWNPTGLSFNLTDLESSLIRRIIIHPDNTNNLVAAGVDGVYASNDAGNTWTKTYQAMIIDIEPNPRDYDTLYAASFYNYAVGGSKAAIYRSTDFGQNWTELNSGIPAAGSVQRVELAVAPSNPDIIYAITCGMNGGLYAFYKTIDAGETWTAMPKNAPGIPNVLGWADGGYFTIPGMPDDDSGQGTYDLTLIVDPNNPNKVYSGGVNMWGSSNGGNNWNLVSFWINFFGYSVHADQHYSKFNPITGDFYQASDGGIIRTKELKIGNLNAIFPYCIDLTNQQMPVIPGCYTLPTVWENVSHGLHITEYYKIGVSEANPDMVSGGTQDNGTFLYRNGEWINTYGGDGMETMIHHTDPNIIFATNYTGALSRSDDGGQTYISSLEAPITDAGERGDWVTPYEMHLTYPDIIFAAFQNIWRSDDLGISWRKIGNVGSVNPTPPMQPTHPFKAMCVAPFDTTYIYAARPGEIVRTKDGGQNWASVKAGLPINEAVILGITVDGWNPENVWVAFSGYQDGKKVYKSTDAGATWENVSGMLPNIPINTIVYQQNTWPHATHALYIGTDIGVFYTNDSIMNTAEKWIPYGDGLPSVIVNELEINYSGQTLWAGTYGRGIWKAPLYTQSFPLGVDKKQVMKGNLEVFPNPVNDILTIKGTLSKQSDYTLSIYTLKGDCVFTQKGKMGIEVNESFNVANLKPATYLLQLEYAGNNISRKFVKH